MEMTHTEAVELLESHGVKVSSEYNGLSVIKACAELVKKLTDAAAPSPSPAGEAFTAMEAALRKRIEAPEHAMPPRMIKELLHVRAGRISDGDMFWIKRDDVPPEALLRLTEWVRHHTGKKVLVMIGKDSTFRHLNGDRKVSLVKKFMKTLTDAERAKVMADYCQCGGPPTCQCWNDE